MAWALYTNAIDGVVGTHARLALSVAAAAGPTPDATLLEDVAVLVQQVPEPSLLVSVLIGLACWRRRVAKTVDLTWENAERRTLNVERSGLGFAG